MRRAWLWPLVPLYGAGLRLADAVRPRPRALRWPVISVGSLSAGGAGKTPVVQMLAGLLRDQGIACDVLTRGYGRGSGVVERVDPAGNARRFGDEPLEMAQQRLEVWVGADRFLAGTAAEEAAAASADGGSEARAHLLDDGFQHRRLRRALEVVLLTLEDTQDCLLPAGNLREPLRALRRADVIVVREEEAPALARWTEGRECWVVRRRMEPPEGIGKRPLAFCGLARPADFFAGLAALGFELSGTVDFPDHHGYTAEDVERLVAAMRHTEADGAVTTSKDAVKLTAAMRARLGEVAVAKLRVIPVDPEAVTTRLLRAIHGEAGRGGTNMGVRR